MPGSIFETSGRTGVEDQGSSAPFPELMLALHPRLDPLDGDHRPLALGEDVRAALGHRRNGVTTRSARSMSSANPFRNPVAAITWNPSGGSAATGTATSQSGPGG